MKRMCVVIAAAMLACGGKEQHASAAAPSIARYALTDSGVECDGAEMADVDADLVCSWKCAAYEDRADVSVSFTFQRDTAGSWQMSTAHVGPGECR